MSPSRDEITILLRRLSETGPDEGAIARLFPVVYDELRRLARTLRRRERSDLTLATTGLVHEAYLKLAGGGLTFEDRAHFFGIAARAMRQVLVEKARRRNRVKRGEGVRPLPLDAVAELSGGDLLDAAAAEEVLALDAALDRLEHLDPRQARVVECRYFAGLSIEETAAALGCSEATVKRDWRTARAWLYHALRQ